MNQHAPDLPRSVEIIGRCRILIGVMAALGLLAGAVFAEVYPADYTSKVVVVFTAPACPAGAICGGPAFPPAYSQAGSLGAVSNGVQITPVTGNVVSVSASAGTAARARAAAEAAARGYIDQADSPTYLGEHASARVLRGVTSATGTAPPKRLEGAALLGAVFGALLGVIMALAGARATIDPLPRDSTSAQRGAARHRPLGRCQSHQKLFTPLTRPGS